MALRDMKAEYGFNHAHKANARNISPVVVSIPIDANGEFDVAIQRKDGFDIIEVKFLKDKVNQTIINEEIKQIKQISEIKIKDYGFISINGFDSGVTKMKYMFTGDDLYFKDESYVQKIKEGEKEDFAGMPSYDSHKDW